MSGVKYLSFHLIKLVGGPVAGHDPKALIGRLRLELLKTASMLLLPVSNKNQPPGV